MITFLIIRTGTYWWGAGNNMRYTPMFYLLKKERPTLGHFPGSFIDLTCLPSDQYEMLVFNRTSIESYKAYVL